MGRRDTFVIISSNPGGEHTKTHPIKSVEYSVVEDKQKFS